MLNAELLDVHPDNLQPPPASFENADDQAKVIPHSSLVFLDVMCSLYIQVCMSCHHSLQVVG